MLHFTCKNKKTKVSIGKMEECDIFTGLWRIVFGGQYYTVIHDWSFHLLFVISIPYSILHLTGRGPG